MNACASAMKKQDAAAFSGMLGYASSPKALLRLNGRHDVHGVRLLGNSVEQTSPILNDFPTGGTCVGIARVPMRTNDDGSCTTPCQLSARQAAPLARTGRP